MFNKIFTIISILIVVSVLLFRFISFARDYLPNRLTDSKAFKFYGISMFILAALLAANYHFFPEFKSDRPFVEVNYNKQYFEDVDYWHPYMQYRNEQITKIKNPFSSELIAIYGKWKKMEEVHCVIEPNLSGGGSRLNCSEAYEYINDSILTIRSSSPVQVFQYHFNDQEKLVRVENRSSDNHITEEYKYDSKGRFSESMQSTKGLIFHKQSAVYTGGTAYVITTTLRDGEVFEKESWNLDQKGFPITMELSRSKQKDSLDPVYEIEFSYLGQKKTSTIHDLSRGIKYKDAYGKGLEFLTRNFEGNLVNSEGYNLNKYEYASNGNWTTKVILRNSIYREIFLRKITYNDGSFDGSLDTNNPKISTLY